jgi:hypothetical protein
MKIIITRSSNFFVNRCVILAIIAIVFLRQTAMAQDSSYTQYLRQNHEKITSGGTNAFAFFDTAFYSNQLFLVSESHGYGKPQELDLQLFKQLNKKVGVRYYLAEVDCSQAHYINKYLNSGNEDFLKPIYQRWFDNRAQWGCKTGFEKWQGMYQYNKTLAAGKKIIVLGLDNAQDLNMNEKLLTEILTGVKYKKGTDVMLDSLLSFATKDVEKDTTKSYIKFIRRFAVAMDKNELAYKKIIKANFFDFRFIINNIASKKGREEKIFENFNSYYAQYKLVNQKMYGFWGRFHAMQDSINGGLSFAAMLNNSLLPLKNKIISIPIYCIESASMLPTAFLPPMAQQKGTIFSKAAMVNDDSFVYSVSGIKTLRTFVGKNESVLFKIAGSASPYNKGLYLVESSSQFDKSFNWEGNKKSVTSNYFQYLIVVSNSDWAVPYGDNTAK